MTQKTKVSRNHRYNPSSDDFQKEDFPFYWLAQVHGRYIQAMEKYLKKVNLDVPRWRILATLKQEGLCSVSEIAQHSIAKLPTVTKIIQRMKDDGLVETQVSVEDGRVTLVLITEKGLSALSDIQHITEPLFKQSFKGITEAQIKRLNKLLEQLFANLPE
ncbi:MarR family winged helix-turn-helix transcriptional regulator [Vibrio viridaestus]|uniref:MarR family transcriptional regulator n=1 Tax=Vibrio viridaestus TaxID=2487322 RepID=A0A3N9TDR2_9VIBR|nr:MarR family winged helix-turn-helix transcriptional regulator [Vibrio viridaestus]RQW62358.1 MarR family transcriptional regulator [Vibrio viridaestus]